MRLENFIVVGGFAGTTLFGLGRHWDLHSFAETRSVHFDPETRSLVIEWAVPAMPNPWGSAGNRARGCRLVFESVLSLTMTDRDPDAPPESESTLAEVSRVVPGEAAYNWIEKGAEPERFRLRFRFESGRRIEVESEGVRLEPVDAPEADDASAPEGEAGRPEPEPEPGSQAGPTKSRISEEPDA